MADTTCGHYAACQENGKFSLHHHLLLADPSLVEDYKDIMKGISSAGSGMKSEEEQSNSASVVFSRPGSVDRKNKGRLITESGADDSQQSSIDPSLNYTMVKNDFNKGLFNIGSGQQSCNVNEGEKLNDNNSIGYQHYSTLTSDLESVVEDYRNYDYSDLSSGDDAEASYTYSDSDFEETLEQILQQVDCKKDGNLDGYAKTLSTAVKCDDVEDKHMPLDEDMIRSSALNNTDDGYQPLPPPQELDPGKLYALYPFQGPDPSHCQLNQDQSCVLVNDQDSYWWLVKRCSDGQIGFAPAELLETFLERLARLNCWKNENISTQSLTGDEVKNQDKVESISSQLLKSAHETNKSVSFNDVVGYAERYIQFSDESDSNSKCVSSSSSELSLSFFHFDELHETVLNDTNQYDDANETLSDAAFTTADMAPLAIKKVRTTNAVDKHTKDVTAAITGSVSDHKSGYPVTISYINGNNDLIISKNDDLKQVLKAPLKRFLQSNGSEIPDSNLFSSTSTIGEYSSLSSEYINDSPQFDTDGTTIPTLRDSQDTSYVDASPKKVTLHTSSDDHCHITFVPQVSILQTSTFSSSSADLHTTLKMGTNDPLLESHKNNQTPLTYITSSQSLTKNGRHPLVEELYNPIFAKIESLQQKLENF